MARTPFAIMLAQFALVVSVVPTSADDVGGAWIQVPGGAGTITGFKMSEVDIYGSDGEFLCVVSPATLAGPPAADICKAPASDEKVEKASIPIESVTDDGQLVVAWGANSYRVDAFQVDAAMNSTGGKKPRCPKLAGGSEMAATRGLGESNCVTD